MPCVEVRGSEPGRRNGRPGRMGRDRLPLGEIDRSWTPPRERGNIRIITSSPPYPWEIVSSCDSHVRSRRDGFSSRCSNNRIAPFQSSWTVLPSARGVFPFTYVG